MARSKQSCAVISAVLLTACSQTAPDSGSSSSTFPATSQTAVSIELEHAYQFESCATRVNLVYRCSSGDHADTIAVVVDGETATYYGNDGSIYSEKGFPFRFRLGQTTRLPSGTQRTISRNGRTLTIHDIRRQAGDVHKSVLRIDFAKTPCSASMEYNARTADLTLELSDHETIYCAATPGNAFGGASI